MKDPQVKKMFKHPDFQGGVKQDYEKEKRIK